MSLVIHRGKRAVDDGGDVGPHRRDGGLGAAGCRAAGTRARPRCTTTTHKTGEERRDDPDDRRRGPPRSRVERLTSELPRLADIYLRGGAGLRWRHDLTTVKSCDGSSWWWPGPPPRWRRCTACRCTAWDHPRGGLTAATSSSSCSCPWPSCSGRWSSSERRDTYPESTHHERTT